MWKEFVSQSKSLMNRLSLQTKEEQVFLLHTPSEQLHSLPETSSHKAQLYPNVQHFEVHDNYCRSCVKCKPIYVFFSFKNNMSTYFHKNLLNKDQVVQEVGGEWVLECANVCHSTYIVSVTEHYAIWRPWKKNSKYENFLYYFKSAKTPKLYKQNCFEQYYVYSWIIINSNILRQWGCMFYYTLLNFDHEIKI